jgi:choline dehydrogenase
VGPADTLQQLGIPVVRDAPQVGAQLVDHPGVTVSLELRPAAQLADRDARSTNCCVRFSSGLAGTHANDMIMIALNPGDFDGPGRAKGTILVSAYQTFSRGRLCIVSPDPGHQPEIDFDMLSDERDLVRMRDGARRLFAIARHPAVEAIAERAAPATLPAYGTGPSLAPAPTIAERLAPFATKRFDELSSDEALDEWLMATVIETMHPVGTCRMGTPGDPRAVVDPECRVIGLEGLRVIDASVMREVPSANTHLTCVMIGERMAEKLVG